MRNEPNGSSELPPELIRILGKPRLQDLPPEVKCLLPAGRADDVLRIAYEKLHMFPFKDVPLAWRRAYEEAAVAKAVSLLSKAQTGIAQDDDDCLEGAWIDEVVHVLDMAVIMTGAPARGDDIERFFRCLSDRLERSEAIYPQVLRTGGRPSKRRRLDEHEHGDLPDTWPPSDIRHPELRRPVPTLETPSLSYFRQHLTGSDPKGGPQPLLITKSISHWPALDPSTPGRNWDEPHYLLRRTAGGRRLVPIEIGRSYTDDDWTQKIVTINAFVRDYMLHDYSADSGKDRAYLAQYDIFTHIPDLRNDIATPDYCYAMPCSSTGDGDDDDAEVVEPQLNAWFGPAGTVSPAHTDPHHNILAQVVGHKYIRLFPPWETPNLYPRGVGEDGVDMHNTSQVDVGLAMRVLEEWDWEDESADFPEEARPFAERFPRYSKADYQEALLAPGDCIYIPRGWWHYVRSLSTSFSVSFWWD